MYKIPKDSKGGANSSHEPAYGKNGIIKDYGDAVGLGAGDKPAQCSPDAKGTDRGFHAKRDDMMGYNPQNQHEVINPEYTRNISYGGKVDYPDEP